MGAVSGETCGESGSRPHSSPCVTCLSDVCYDLRYVKQLLYEIATDSATAEGAEVRTLTVAAGTARLS